MKNAILSGNALTRLVKPAALALLFVTLIGTAPAHAGGHTPKDVPVEVKYLGSTNGKPLVQIVVNNAQGEEVGLSLRDDTGVLIYADTIKGKTYSRTLQFDDVDLDGMKLNLTLRTKSGSQTKAFEITRSTRTVEDVAVVSL